ncbi:MAG: hypothetical protein L6Q95_07495 [Planctomycetes bacterium]|nr:hypothetical protein [Planctomycetota bacterium]
MRGALPVLAVCLLLPAGESVAQEKAKPYWVGKKFPALSAPDSHWVVRRLKAEEYKGRFLWVEIGFLG